MTAALIITSPLCPVFQDVNKVIDLARVVKAHDVDRADLGLDPGRAQGSSHEARYPVPDAERMAENFSQTIFRPMIGQSTVRSMPQTEKTQLTPHKSLANYHRVAKLMRMAPEDNVSDAGLALYAAMWARTTDDKPYDLLVFPRMTQKAVIAFGKVGPVTTKGKVAWIDLLNMRLTLAYLEAGRGVPPWSAMNPPNWVH